MNMVFCDMRLMILLVLGMLIEYITIIHYTAHSSNKINAMIDGSGRNVTKLNHVTRIIIRDVKLYSLSTILNGGYYLEHWRIPGVLEYCGIAYYVEICCAPECRNLWMQGVFLFWKQLIVALVVLTINLLLVYILQVSLFGDNCGKGYIGIGDYGKYIECTGGVHRWIDIKLFGYNYIYENSNNADNNNQYLIMVRIVKHMIYLCMIIMTIIYVSFAYYLQINSFDIFLSNTIESTIQQ